MGRLVVGIDGSANARAALAWAIDEAKLRGDDLKVVTVSNAPVLPDDDLGVVEREQRDAERLTTRHAGDLLDEALAPFADTGVPIKTQVLRGVAYEALIGHAAGSSGLVVGARGHSAYRRLLLGSVSQQVVVHAHDPVVVVPPPDSARHRWHKVIVGMDGSEGARLALARATEEARLRGCELEAVAVLPPPAAPGDHTLVEAHVRASMWVGMPGPRSDASSDVERRRQQVVDQWRDDAERHLTSEIDRLVPGELPATVTPMVIGDRHPARALLDMAKRADLLVVGSRGRGGFVGMLLGSVSQQCVRHATAPVLVVPGHAA